LLVQEVAAKYPGTVTFVSENFGASDAPAAQAFGDITAVPTMFLFDRSGKTARVLYGAPPGLHEQVSKILDALTN
jgi:hypothetical protein